MFNASPLKWDAFTNFPLHIVRWQVQNLFAGVVDVVVIGVNEVANWAKLQVFEFERLKYQGQCFHDVVAVVVAQDDVAGLGFLHALGNLAGGNALPIQAIHTPLDGVQSKFGGNFYQLVVVVAKGRAKQFWHLAGKFVNLLATAF